LPEVNLNECMPQALFSMTQLQVAAHNLNAQSYDNNTGFGLGEVQPGRRATVLCLPKSEREGPRGHPLGLLPPNSAVAFTNGVRPAKPMHSEESETG
jgi:hypothetical protein